MNFLSVFTHGRARCSVTSKYVTDGCGRKAVHTVSTHNILVESSLSDV